MHLIFLVCMNTDHSTTRVCSKTVMDSTDPSTVFDSEGISNHYWDYHRNVKQHLHDGPEGELLLAREIEKSRPPGARDFDCIIE